MATAMALLWRGLASAAEAHDGKDSATRSEGRSDIDPVSRRLAGKYLSA